MSYFEEDVPRRPEIVEGLFREGQIITFAGPFNVGKTPLLADLAAHIATGTMWCGHKVAQRPIFHFDFESSDPDFRRMYRNISAKMRVKLKVPEDVVPYLLSGDANKDARTKELLSIESRVQMLQLLHRELTTRPSALIIFDPVELAFTLDVMKKDIILNLYRKLRELLAKFPKAAVLSTHNLRKDQRQGRGTPPNLMLDPHGWLQEVAGSLDLINRSDVRLGVNRYMDNVIVVNGARRGEELHPMLLSPVDDDPEELAGFKNLVSNKHDLSKLLSDAQMKYWSELPEQFKFSDYAANGIPKGSLSRLLKRCSSLGLVVQQDGIFIKVPLN